MRGTTDALPERGFAMNNYSFKSDIYYCTLSLVLHITWDGNRGLMLKLAVEG